MTITNTILSSQTISPGIRRIEIFQPEIAHKAKPGQFVIVHLNDKGERVPLTIVDTDREKNTITLIVQQVGKSTQLINQMKMGEVIQDILGPLGTPTEIARYGTALVIGGGVGTAVAYPVAKALKTAGNTLIGMIGARSKEFIILEPQLKEICDEVFIATDDGSVGFHGNTANLLQQLLGEGRKFDLVYASGPLLMLKAITELTRQPAIKTIVSLNSLMVDGTGMCGGCRTNVGGKVLFTCVDGPDFDAHLVDFDTIIQRNNAYRQAEESTRNQDPSSVKPAVKKRLPIPRLKMPTQDAQSRIKNFNEVNLGYPEAAARLEALRCLQCGKPACVDGCPVNVQIPHFIQKIVDGDYLGAAAVYKYDNTLASVCARVCPQSEQCEGICILAKKGEAVAIGNLARFVLDVDRQKGRSDEPPEILASGHKVAVIGSGPAGLACAGDLIKLGHQVTVFEALHDFGGVLSYGIPEFRLPKSIVREEIEALRQVGVVFEKNQLIGATFTIDELFQMGYEAVFIGTGAGLPYFMNIPGENLIGVYSANEFLIRVNLMRAYDFPNYDTPLINCVDKVVAVIGGGNTALDSARVALRLGAREVHVIYRRTEEDMPARKEEYEHAKEEGIQFHFLCTPVRFNGNSGGWLTSAILQKMAQGEVDASGRRSPVPVEGSEFEMELEVVIVAVGNGSNPIIQKTTPDLAFNKRGNLVVDPETMATNRPGVYSGGDIVTGGATVIRAMGAGRKAAAAIDLYLKKKNS
jgi:glutamate synthase (NADPH/NADH) small chain